MRRVTTIEPQGLENQLRAQIKMLWVTIGMLALAVAVALVMFGLFGSSALNRLDRQDAALHLHALHACESTNITRALRNQGNNADYGVFLFVQRRFSIPTPTETQAQKAITDEFASTLRASLRAKTWVELTDCTDAHGDIGIKIHSIADGPPPASQMSVANASRPDPSGSTP